MIRIKGEVVEGLVTETLLFRPPSKTNIVHFRFNKKGGQNAGYLHSDDIMKKTSKIG